MEARHGDAPPGAHRARRQDSADQQAVNAQYTEAKPPPQPRIERVAEAALAHLPRLVEAWLPAGTWRGHEYVAGDLQGNPGESLSINTASGRWSDFATGDAGGDPVSLLAALRGYGGEHPQLDAARELAAELGLDVGERPAAAPAKADKGGGKATPITPVPADAPAPPDVFNRREKDGSWTRLEVSQRWEYRDAEGRLLGCVCRFDLADGGKEVIPQTYCEHEDGTRRWRWLSFAKPRPLYGLDRLAAHPGANVIVVEGEKAAQAAQRLVGDRVVVVSWPGGGKAIHHTDWSALAGRKTVIWPDADEAGRDTAEGYRDAGGRTRKGVAQLVEPHAAGVRVLDPPDDVAEGWDLADAERDGWTADDVLGWIREHVRQATPRDPSAGANDEPHSADLSDPSRGVMIAPPPYAFPHVNGRGKPKATIANVRTLLRSCGVVARYNVIAKAHELIVPGVVSTTDNAKNVALAHVSSLAAEADMPLTELPRLVSAICDEQPHNPAREFIRARPWDGQHRLDDLLDTLSPTHRDLTRKLLWRWMVSAVAAVERSQGVAAQGVLVLRGDQGIGKSRWLSRLAPDDLVLPGALLNPADRDSAMRALTHWIVELAELDATFRRADIAALKAFLTRDVDEYRRPYERADSRFARRTVFAATVNDKTYLVDTTGNRRYWTVEINDLDPDHGVDVQQLWAEIAQAYDYGEQWHLTEDEERALARVNDAHESDDPIGDLILAVFDPGAPSRTERMTAGEVLRAAGYSQPSPYQSGRAGRVLREHFGEPTTVKGRRVWKLPEPNEKQARQSGWGW